MKVHRPALAAAHARVASYARASLLALCTLLAASACSSEAKRDPSQFPISRAELERGAVPSLARPHASASDDSAELTYRRYCIGCHGGDGHGNEGTTGADLAAVDGPLATRSDAELITSVRDGKVGKLATMPAHKPILTEVQIAAVLAYVRKQFAPPSAK